MIKTILLCLFGLGIYIIAMRSGNAAVRQASGNMRTYQVQVVGDTLKWYDSTVYLGYIPAPAIKEKGIRYYLIQPKK